MPDKKFSMEQLKILVSEEHIKAYVHPTRMTIVSMISNKQRTISSVAKELGVHPANITHHFKLLEKSGLIKLVEKRDNGKNIEKYYRAVAYAFEVRMNESKPSNKQALALSVLRDNLAAAIKHLENSSEKKVIGLLNSVRINHDNLSKFEKKLMKLINEFNLKDTADGESYILNISMYPNDSGASGNGKVFIK